MVAVITAFREYVRGVDRVVLLFSGGADSSLLLALGAAVLGDRLTALTFTGPHTAPGELASAWSLARRLGVRHLVREMDLLTLPEFRYNTPARCYACKQTLTAQGWQMARAWGAHALWDGTNRDDLRDFRPGLKATREAGVASPLLELGLGKREIRKFSAALGLPGDKPPQSCLATRFPYGTELSREILARVGGAETWLRRRGFGHVRLRVQGELAVLELETEDVARFMRPACRGPFSALVANLGWRYLEVASR
ncbi:MAG: ATP-dependent sacrificial sulfur transferase LarE [Deltaproteobacteria bacterium]|nr:ATP-dependent sacrificial sulfur transferase LarE [Deltaproteobacteria bacterium]